MINKQESLTDKEALMSFVENLTDEEVEKIISHLPELSALLAESFRPCHQECP